MTFIFLIFIAFIWLLVVLFIAVIVTKKINKTQWKLTAFSLSFVILFPLPLIDEIIVAKQFELLCKNRAKIIVDNPVTNGKTIMFGGNNRTEFLLGSIKVTESQRIFVDANTQEPIYHYLRFDAKGGWLINALKISEESKPLLFPSVCQPADLENIDSQLGLTYINRSISK